MLEKCPYCGKFSMGELSPATGTSYILTEVNDSVTPAQFIPTSGMPVKFYGCAECKGVLLKAPSLKINR